MVLVRRMEQSAVQRTSLTGDDSDLALAGAFPDASFALPEVPLPEAPLPEAPLPEAPLPEAPLGVAWQKTNNGALVHNNWEGTFGASWTTASSSLSSSS